MVGAMQDDLSCANITIIDDASFESDHSFSVNVTNVELESGGTDALLSIGVPSYATIYIEDNDREFASLLSVLKTSTTNTIAIETLTFYAAADVAFNQAQYSVQESESSLMVCAEISGVPAEGLECDAVVTFVLFSNGTKAGMLPPK